MFSWVGQSMSMSLRAVGTLPDNVDWSLINPGLLGVEVMERGGHWMRTRNLTTLMQRAVDEWSEGAVDRPEGSSSVVVLTAMPMQRAKYHLVVVAYEREGDQSASVEV